MLLALSFDFDCDDYVSLAQLVGASARHRNHLKFESSLLRDAIINAR